MKARKKKVTTTEANIESSIEKVKADHGEGVTIKVHYKKRPRPRKTVKRKKR